MGRLYGRQEKRFVFKNKRTQEVYMHPEDVRIADIQDNYSIPKLILIAGDESTYELVF